MLQVDELQVLVQKLDGPRCVLEGILNLFALQESPQDAQVLAEVADFHGIHTHDAHCGMARTYAKKDTSWRNSINRSD